MLGNLVCAVSSDVIRNSDPEILENLKNCKDLSDSQISAMQELLMKGTSVYGQVILSRFISMQENLIFSPYSVHWLWLCGNGRLCLYYLDQQASGIRKHLMIWEFCLCTSHEAFGHHSTRYITCKHQTQPHYKIL